MSRDTIIAEVVAELKRADRLWGESFDKHNSEEDWVAFITTYAGRAASERNPHNCGEGTGFRKNMLKVAGIAIAAVEAQDAK